MHFLFVGKLGHFRINLNMKYPEFIEWKWIDVEMLPEVIVEFKKNLYLNLLKEIKLVID